MEVCRFILVTFIFIYSTKALDVCKDKRSDCLKTKHRCHEKWWVKNCMKTCGICTDAGCSDGYYEDDSRTRCKPCNKCKDNACNKQDGDCINGCKINYHGERCTEDCPKNCDGGCDQNSRKCVNCIDNKYGDKCGKRCEPSCQNGCDRDTGKCVNCISNKYGDTCGKSCEGSCKDGCDRDTGQCNGCRNNRYGKKCELPCSRGCRNGCNQDTGICIDGCNNRRYGDFCNVTCPTECKTGCDETGVCRGVKKCPEKCTGGCDENNNCKDNIDCTVNNNCPTSACSINCKQCDQSTGTCRECNKGYYGSNCNLTCSDNCYNQKCNPDGTCSSCKTGYHGSSCNLSCSNNCYNDECSKDGSCSSCKTGYHGSSCNLTCGANCFHKRCDTDGTCFSCKKGYYGSSCNLACSDNCYYKECSKDGSCSSCKRGYHGSSCQSKCSEGCSTNYCHKIDGSCSCKSGYSGRQCTGTCINNCEVCDPRGCSKCNKGWFGDECHHQCPDNCLDRCYKYDGKCTHCKDNFVGDFCNGTCNGGCKIVENRRICYKNGKCKQGCNDGMYGNACNVSCSVSCEGGCDQDNGKCNKCKSGYHGETCEKCSSQCDGGCDQSDGRCYKCESGYHGKACDESCSSECVGGCMQESGTCIKCIDGYRGHSCQDICSIKCKSCEQYSGQCTECKEGYWGLYCNNTCSSTCKPRISSTVAVCHLYNGTCIEGCQPGHTGHNCTTACEDGYYGDGCYSNCGKCYNNKPCDAVTGSCGLEGCDSGFTGTTCNLTQEERGGTATAVIIAIPILCIVAVVVIIGFILYRRKRSERKEGENEFVENDTCLVAVDPAVVNDATGIYENLREESVYQNVGEVSRSPTRIDLKDLWDYNQDMKEKKFDLEYQDLPKGLCSPHGVCLNEVNKGKNRYKDICAFDHTRVKIDIENGDPNSDYYNACYITGYGGSKRKYIASQGPIATNINDFWRMLWFVEARKIVMLTNLVEMAVIKCLQYWPDLDQTVKYGNITVTMISEEVFAHFVIRTLKVAKDNCETQTLRQYHYISWPDKGVPKDMTSLLEFHRKVQGMKADLKGPLTVHCSAGIGRTGTFIALDYLIEEGLAEKSVDVNQCVARMRYERVNMVQAKEQYQFLHDIIAEWYFTKDTITNTDTFTDSYKNMLQVEKTGGKNGLREILDMMSKMCKKPNMDEFSEAMSESNIGKPSRVCLGTPVPDDIAAVYMPSYMTKRAYIVTQTPTTNTVDDFWRMIFESNCQIIVSLDKDQGRNSKNLEQYFSPKAGKYSIHIESEEDHSQGFYSKITCHVKSNVNLDQNRKIRIFSCSFWPSKLKVPKSSTPMICLLEDIATLRRTSTDGPIVVHCLDGNEKNGVFCTLAAAIERIVQERSVRIIPTINQLRISRHDTITSYEQLKFCFDTIAEYLSKYDNYCH